MPAEEKPYRVYRGGRTKGKVPAPPRPGRPGTKRAPGDGGAPPDGRVEYHGPGAKPKRRRFGWGRRIALGIIILLLLVIAWGVTSFLAFRNGAQDANARLDPNTRLALTEQSGLLLSHPTTILLLGTDHNKLGGREGDRHSDSIMLVRTDPSRHRLSYLSIPRDLRVAIPGSGVSKINAAFQIGGPTLALKTITEFTGIPVNHVVIVDFADFQDLIDSIGGIDVNVPARIVSNRFDCPYATEQRCQQWEGWRFRKGQQHMDGRRALVYSRIRENRLDPSESDVTRGERQQRVLQAISSKLTSPRTLVKLPFMGDELAKPLATDLSAGQLAQLGWVKFRSSSGRSLHCRLGGTGSFAGGQSVIEPSEDNRNVLAMFLGRSAPQPPAPGSGPYGPGCVVGDRALPR
jgi:LCP family protein required for cell wall assembly